MFYPLIKLQVLHIIFIFLSFILMEGMRDDNYDDDEWRMIRG